MGMEVYGSRRTFINEGEQFPDAFNGGYEGGRGRHVDDFRGGGTGSRSGDCRVKEGSFLDFLALRDELIGERREAGGVG